MSVGRLGEGRRRLEGYREVRGEETLGLKGMT